MGLADYLEKYGHKGLEELAEKAGTSKGYLTRLAYQPWARPSLNLAARLVKASGGVLTFEGLANPRKYQGRRERSHGRAAV